MYFEIVNDLINLFGLNYVPQTFPELITWFVCVMCAVGLLAGVIKMLFYIAANSRRLVG